MKYRVALFIFFASLLTACNLTLAEDVTPPPNYVPPTPAPTLGPLFPAQAPKVADGAAIYAEKCEPCHGNAGLGDGPQGLQLGVTVKAIGLPEVARPSSPQEYYTVVTRGNMERMMPPFSSLDDQQRWDVIAYVWTLHTTPEQVEKGKALFEANCANCSTDYFTNQQNMSKLSDVDLARLIHDGGNGVQPFGKNLSEDDLWAVTAYLRSLSFDTSLLAQPTTAPVDQTPVAAESGSPSAAGTPNGTGQTEAGNKATPVPEAGTVSGSIDNKTGASMPSDLQLTLHGFNHATGQNQNNGATEVLTMKGTVNPNGTFTFKNVDLQEGRIFIAEVAYNGITLQSEYGVVAAGQTSLTLSPITLYPITEDISGLVIDELHLFFQASSASSYDILALYNFRNAGETMVAVKMASNQQEIPFLKFPKGAQGVSYEIVQDSAPLTNLDQGFALAPGEKPYDIAAFSSLPIQEQTSVTQEFALPAAMVRIFVPSGVNVKGGNFTPGTSQDIQGTKYQTYVATNIKAGEALNFELSGTPVAAGANAGILTSRNWLLIGIGALGLALISAGGWMYWRDRKRVGQPDEEAESDEFKSSDEILDAIITLDDLHRDKKISEEAYQKRRAELKDILKEMM